MTTINVFGDSHAKYFGLTPKLRNVLGIQPAALTVNMNVVPGSTVKGLGRRTSSLKMRELIASTVRDGNCYVISFGQVDIELGMYYSLVVKRDSFDPRSYIDDLSAHYAGYIEEVTGLNKKVAVKGANYTAIKDKRFGIMYVSRIIGENVQNRQEKADCARALARLYHGEQQRNGYIELFNTQLMETCRKASIPYFEINDYLCGGYKQRGIRDCFVPVATDHHIADSIEVRMIHHNNMMRCLSHYRGG